MRGRLQLDKVNIAINELASCANITAQLIAKPKKKVNVFQTVISCFLCCIHNPYSFDMLSFSVLTNISISMLQMSDEAWKKVLVCFLILLYLILFLLYVAYSPLVFLLYMLPTHLWCSCLSVHDLVITVLFQIQEIKEVARSENVKGKHFLLECDVKGPGLKLDNTGKATLTVSD